MRRRRSLIHSPYSASTAAPASPLVFSTSTRLVPGTASNQPPTSSNALTAANTQAVNSNFGARTTAYTPKPVATRPTKPPTATSQVSVTSLKSCPTHHPITETGFYLSA